MWMVAWGDSRPEEGGVVRQDFSNLFCEDDALARARRYLEEGRVVFSIWNDSCEIYDEATISEMLGPPRKT